MVLAERGGAVTVLAQNLGQSRNGLGADASVTGKRGSQFHDRAGVVGVVIVPGQQRHTRRAAKRGCMEAIVLKPAGRKPVERGHPDRPSKGAAVAETEIIDQHDDNVGRAGRRLYFEPWRRFGIACIEHRDRFGCWRRNGKHGAVEPQLPVRWLRCVSHLRERGRNACPQDSGGSDQELHAACCHFRHVSF